MTIIVQPDDLGRCANWYAAWIACLELRSRGYNAFAGYRGTSSAGPANVDYEAWQAARNRVADDIRGAR